MAGGARDVRAGGAFVEIYANDNALKRALDAAANKVKAFARAIAAVGVGVSAAGSAITAPLIFAAKTFSEMGSKMLESSQRTGVGVEALSELAFAAKQSGVEMESLEGAFKGMSKFVSQAADGSAEATSVLRDLGLTLEDINGLSPDKMLMKFADGLATVGHPAQQAAAAMKVFGKAGFGIQVLLQEGSSGIEKMRKEARSLGLTMSTESATAADAFGDALDALWAQIKMVTFTVGEAVAGPFMLISGTLKEVAKGTIDFAKANAPLISTLTVLGTAMMATGAALVGLATAVGLVGFTIGNLAMVAGLLTSPLVIIGTAVAAGIILFTDLNKVVDSSRVLFAGLGETFSATLSGMVDSMKSGDLEGTVKIVGLGINVAWLQVCAALNSVWGQTWADMKTGMLDFGIWMRTKLAELVYAFRSARDTMAEFAPKVASVLTGGASDLVLGGAGDADKAKKDRDYEFNRELRKIAEQKKQSDRDIANDLIGNRNAPEIAAAKAELDAAVAEARAKVVNKVTPPAKDKPGEMLDIGKVDVRGGYDASLIARMAPAGGTPAERKIIENLKEISLNTKAMIDRLQGAQFT
jgi:hypothetical protein